MPGPWTKARRCVPNDALREAFLASDRTASDLARSLGYFRIVKGRQVADDAPVRRALGLRTYRRKGREMRQRFMHYDTAVRFCEALGLDPVDVGL
jgi:hypothetical protein